jgi:hypothetical protein
MILTTGIGLQKPLTHSTPYISHSSNSVVGQVRYYGNNFEVYDGYNWISITQTAHIELTVDVIEILDWAKKKRDRDNELEKLKDNPAIADLLRQRAALDDQLEMVKILLTTGNDSTGTHGSN